jgi:AraC-like DNA-binding protein
MEQDPSIPEIPKPNLSGQVAFSPAQYFSELVDFIYESNIDSDLGVRFGNHLSPMNVCDFSRLLTTSTSIRDGLDIMINYYHMLGLKPFPSVHESYDTFSVAIAFPYEESYHDGCKRFAAETFYSYAINYVRDIINPDLNPKRIFLDFSKPTYGDTYLEKFRCPIEYEAPLSMIEFSHQIIDAPLPTANPSLHKVYLNKAIDAWQTLKRLQSTRYRTITQIMQHAPDYFNSQVLADSMNISVRGLQKRLSAEGSSISFVTQLARRELTKTCMIQKGMDIEDTAKALGFQTLASFRKFFKQQFGTNPTSFLRTLHDLS